MTPNTHLNPVAGAVPTLHDAPSFPADFDPGTVPPFPVIVLEVSPTSGVQAYVTPYTVTMDGEPVPVPHRPVTGLPNASNDEPMHEPAVSRLDVGGDPAAPTTSTSSESREHAFAVALDAASRRIAARGWHAARVNAIDADGHRWPMIVGANGERLDLSTSAAPERNRRRWIPLAAAVVAVVLSATTIGTVLATRHVAAPTAPPLSAASPVSRPTAQPAEYPMLPPVGASTHARWAFGSLADTSSFVQAPTGEVLVRTTDHLTLLDPTNGIPGWTTEVPVDTTGPWVGAVDGQPVVVTGTSVSTTVTWRPLADLNQTHVVPVDTSAALTPLPGGLLFSTADARVGLLAADDTLTTRLMPAGTEAVGVDGLSVLASNGRQLWRLDRDQPQTPDPVTLQLPGRGARPGTDAVWRGGRLLTFWTLPGTTSNGTARTVAALHTPDGRLVKVIPVQAQPFTVDQVKVPDQRYTLLSNGTVVDHVNAALIPAAPAWQGTTLIGGILYGRSGDQPARYDLTDRKVTTSPAATAADPVGRLDNDLLAVADRGGSAALYRLQPAG